MTAPYPVDLRAAALEAVRLLDHEPSSAAQQARQLLTNAFQTTLPPAARAALDADQGVQAAITRIAADRETYVIANDDGTPGTTPLERSADEQPL